MAGTRHTEKDAQKMDLEEHLRLLEAQSADGGLALGDRDVRIRTKRREDDDSATWLWKVKGFPRVAGAEEVQDLLQEHFFLQDVHVRSKLHCGAWTVSAVAPFGENMIAMQLLNGRKTWCVIGWIHNVSKP